ncbi:MAG: Asp-tRNA(Asn)/Glu-tRNA(Gln) amidotransferase GatCAB subunit A [Waddliaceae bacterium]|nr:Asp-tRNA(Asn)/Glu-tRNA(Gln) amidotransferase GatCAB subunit A [Waddliaceae bacterium]
MYHKTALEIRDSFLSGEVTAIEISKYFLDRIDRIDPDVKAFLQVYHERAMKVAERLDAKRAAGEPLGKLAGIPIALKDNIHVKGEVSTCASQFLDNYVAPFDSTVTRLLEAEDAIIIGKTNLDEFAMGSSTENSSYQQTKNPWNTDCVPGGSSGGSAAAVAARLCPIALGSDTGGSIRQPASLCGILGMKSTYGRVSRFGLVAFGSSLDQIGPFANSAEDIALVMEVLGQHCEKDSTSIPEPSENYLDKISESVSGLKVGVPRDFLDGLKEESRNRFDANLKVLKDLGCELVDIKLDILHYGIPVYYILATAEASTNLARFDGVRYGKRSEKAQTLDEVYDLSKEEGYGDEVKRRILLGTFVLSSGYQNAFYRKAQKVRTLIIKQYKECFEKCDIICMPCTTNCAFPLGAKSDPIEMYQEDLFTVSANLAGIPAISVPSGFTSKKMPVGIQFLAPQKQDVQVCRMANAYSKATGFHKEIPELANLETVN